MSGAQQAFQRAFAKQQRRILRNAEANLADAVEAGALALDRALEDATTDTGYFRMLTRGGRPGRHETGNMVSKIRTDAMSPKRDAGRITMAFGWFAGDFEAYFREQDLGGPPEPGFRRGIPPALALTDPAREGNRGIAADTAVSALRVSMGRGL